MLFGLARRKARKSRKHHYCIYARALPVAIAPDQIGAVLGVDLAGLREVDLVDVARGREVRSLVRQVERVV